MREAFENGRHVGGWKWRWRVTGSCEARREWQDHRYWNPSTGNLADNMAEQCPSASVFTVLFAMAPFNLHFFAFTCSPMSCYSPVN